MHLDQETTLVSVLRERCNEIHPFSHLFPRLPSSTLYVLDANQITQSVISLVVPDIELHIYHVLTPNSNEQLFWSVTQYKSK